MSFFSHSLDLFSTALHLPYTNYTVAFKELLDYIFVSRSMFQVKQVSPIPPPQQLEEYIAIPNAIYPSDHFSVTVDLEFI